MHIQKCISKFSGWDGLVVRNKTVCICVSTFKVIYGMLKTKQRAE